MKRTRIKRKSKSPLRIAIDTADRALQDWYRANYPDVKCESCGSKFQLMHHFIEKSRSTFLRYDNRNLIFLCGACHSAHHQFHDTRVMNRVILKRGQLWLKTLMDDANIHSSMTKQRAEEEIIKWSIKQKDKLNGRN